MANEWPNQPRLSEELAIWLSMASGQFKFQFDERCNFDPLNKRDTPKQIGRSPAGSMTRMTRSHRFQHTRHLFPEAVEDLFALKVYRVRTTMFRRRNVSLSTAFTKVFLTVRPTRRLVQCHELLTHGQIESAGPYLPHA